MAITNGYCTLAQMRHADVLNISASDTTSDANIELIVEAASRHIDDKTGRHFYSASETRYYTAADYRLLFIDDLVSVSAMVTDDGGDGTYENTWTTSDYRLLPTNNSLVGGWPYTMIEVKPFGSFIFPQGIRDGVKITGTFGWSATPKPITDACILLSARLYRRWKATFGVAGATSVGQVYMSIPKLDPDVEMLIKPYMRLS